MTTQITHLRGIAALRPLRGRHPAVIVCLDDPAPFQLSGVDMGQSAGDWS